MSFKDDATFIIMGKEGCGHCIRAKETLKAKGLEYEYNTLGQNYTKEELLAMCAPIIPTTLPRIFLDTGDKLTYIGTCDEMVAYIQANY